MKTPICDFVEKYAEDGKLRLHMPGHKGYPFLGIEGRDITEVDGADVLYMSEGIIKESEENASHLFGTGKTLYSTEGSSLCIRAMVHMAAVMARAKRVQPIVWAARNAHKTFLSGAALCGVKVEWLFGEGSQGLLSCRITSDYLEKKLKEAAALPVMVYITSPDYLGNVADIRNLSAVCRKYGVILAVDNAHGAYLRFLPEDGHPITLGADICCDSAHKTLPVLTGGAYLHISKQAHTMIHDMAERSMSLFASTSPSYLILQSLDKANRHLSGDYKERLAKLAEDVDEAKKQLALHGYVLAGDEKTKLTLKTKPYGYMGDEVAEYLRQNSIECEFADPDHVVLMLTPEIRSDDISRLVSVMTALPRKAEIETLPPCAAHPEATMDIREAMMSPSELVSVTDAKGRVLAEPSVACPPAVPIIACGEMVDEAAIECFKYYGTEKIRVVIKEL